MITKNKQTPTTLYLVHTKANKFQQQQKSARPTFNKKKSSRSISQYKQYTNNSNTKQTINSYQVSQPFHQNNSNNSQIKKLILNKNQYTTQSLDIVKRLSLVLNVFQGKKASSKSNSNDSSLMFIGKSSTAATVSNNTNNTKATILSKSKDRIKAKISSNNIKTNINTQPQQQSFLSIKEFNQYEKQQKSHRRTLSQMKNDVTLLNNEENQTLQSVINKIEGKFKEYDKLMEQWKLKYMYEDNDYLITELVKMFRSMINDIKWHYSQQIVSNVAYFQQSLTNVAKQYEIQIASLKEQLSKTDQLQEKLNNMALVLKQKHCKGVIFSKINEQLQKNGIDIEQIVKSSQIYPEIIQINQKFLEQKVHSTQNRSQLKYNQKLINICSDEQISQAQKFDFVQQDSNWNKNFQNKEGIKDVLNYIHNHNSTKPDMKIANWNNLAGKNNVYQKIMSQR